MPTDKKIDDSNDITTSPSDQPASTNQAR